MMKKTPNPIHDHENAPTTHREDTKDNRPYIPILDVGGVLISTSILTECFCCYLTACGGACCIEGDAGAPVTLDEIGEIEQALDAAWPLMSASAQSIVDRQGVACTDAEGELVTSIVNGKDCVFTYYDELPVTPASTASLGKGGGRVCLCALENVCRSGQTQFMKPISCALYPIREKHFGNGLIGLNLHHWAVCDAAYKRGRELHLPVYRFLREPLIRRFGEAWYQELEETAAAFFREYH